MVSESINRIVMDREMDPNGDLSWKSLYRAAGVAALLAVLVGLLDIFMMFLPGTGVTPGTLSVTDWFSMFQGNWFLGLRNLGLFNLLTTSCTILVFFALYWVYRFVNPVYAALALILVCMGATIYIANNTALPMLNLSAQYTAATTDSQKALLITAARAVLAREDLTAGAFMGFFFTEIAAIMMAFVMLRGRIFSRWAAWTGIVGEASLLIFNICAAFVPALYGTAMIFAMVGGPVSMVWLFLIALRLFRMA
jgi:hypothetical protein